MRTPALLVVVTLFGCGPAPEFEVLEPGASPGALQVRPPVKRMTFRLEERTGTAPMGWSFSLGRPVPAAEADLTLFAFDCGARGRWVQLASRNARLCPRGPAWNADRVTSNTEDCGWTQWLDVAGTRPEADLGDGFIVRVGGEVVGHLVLTDRTALAADWYARPVEPVEVTVELSR